MSSIMGLLLGVPFVIFWIVTASKSGAPVFFVFFGVAFLGFLVVQISIGFYNATSKNRISQVDITTDKEESDPFSCLTQKDVTQDDQGTAIQEVIAGKTFCPFCGTKLEQAFKFCPKCGKPQPAV